MDKELEGDTLECKSCHKQFWRPKGSSYKKCRDCRHGMDGNLKDAMDRANRLKKKVI